MSTHQSAPQSDNKIQSESSQNSAPEKDTSSPSDSFAIQRLVGTTAAGAGNPNDTVPNRIKNLPASQRSQAILQMQRTQGNAFVQRALGAKRVSNMIQREPDDSPATPANSAQQGDSAPQAPEKLSDDIMKKLLSGGYNYGGYYSFNRTTGDFLAFADGDLETARKYFIWWAEQVKTANPEESLIWEQQMILKSNKRKAEERAKEKERIAANKEKKRQADVERLRTDFAAVEKAKADVTAKYSDLIANAKTERHKNQLIKERDQILAAKKLRKQYYDPGAWDAFQEEREEQEFIAQGHTHEDFLVEKETREVNKIIFDDLLQQLATLKQDRETLATTEQELPQKLEAVKKAEADYNEALETYKTASESDPNYMAIRIDAANKSQAYDTLRSGYEALEKNTKEKTALTLREEFSLRTIIVNIAEKLKIQTHPVVNESQEFLNKAMESEQKAQKETNDVISSEIARAKDTDQGASTDDVDGAAPHKLSAESYETDPQYWAKSKASLSNIFALISATSDESLYEHFSANAKERMKAKDDKKKDPVIAGDTQGHKVQEHPNWFYGILQKLMGLAPMIPIKQKVTSADQRWDDEASAAQAVLIAYLNAWTKQRIAKYQGVEIANTDDDEAAEKKLKNVKIPSNLEVLNASIGFSETNEKSEIFLGLKNMMDWCGPASERSVILGLWKAGLFFDKGSTINSPYTPPHRMMANQEKAEKLVQEIEALQKKTNDPNRKQMEAEIRPKFLTLWGWLLEDLRLSHSRFIGQWFGEGSHEKAYQPGGKTIDFAKDQRRQIDLPDAATAPLYPGDFVYWSSSFPYGPISGHVATIVEEKNFNSRAAQANEFVSSLRVVSGNSQGVRQGEGAVRPEEVTRTATNNFNYWAVAGRSNAYYYGSPDSYISRSGYDSAVSELALMKRAKAIREQAYTPAALEKHEQDLADPKKKGRVKPLPPQWDDNSGEAQQLRNKQAEVEYRASQIVAYKSNQEFPVHKTPQTDADRLGVNKWNTRKFDITPNQEGAVWIVSIKRTSRLSSDQLAEQHMKPDGTVDEAGLAQKRLQRMPPGIRDLYQKTLEIAGLGMLFQTDHSVDFSKPPSDQPKK